MMRYFLFSLILFVYEVKAERTDIEVILDTSSDEFINRLKPNIVNNNPVIYEWRERTNLQFGDELGVYNTPNIRSRVVRRTVDKIVYDVVYTHDEFGRRVSPVSPKDFKEAIVIQGCSFAYGEALDDDGTLDTIINSQNKKIYAYNYGVRSSGTNVFLNYIQKRKILDEIPFNTIHTTLIYWDALIARSVGTYPAINYVANNPYFEKENGRLVRKGPIKDRDKLRYWFIEFVKRTFPDSYISDKDFPSLKTSDYNYYCEILQEIKKDWLEISPKGRFSIYIHPFSRDNDSVIDCAKKFNIGLIFPSQETKQVKDAFLYLDGHPSKNLNLGIANDILRFYLQN